MDGTSSVLEKLAASFPALKIIHHASNQGYGAARRTGFRNSSKDLIFYTDGDGQYDARELAALVPLMTPYVDVVNGYKLKRADNHYPRAHGESQFFTLRSVAHTAYDFFMLWWEIVVIERLLPAKPALKERGGEATIIAEQPRSSSE